MLLRTGIRWTGGCLLVWAVAIVAVRLMGTRLESQIVSFLAGMDAAVSNFDVLMQDVRGGTQFNLTRHSAMDYEFVWSADGARLALISNRTGSARIHILSATGQELATLETGLFPLAIAWSPNMTQIALTAARDSTLNDIYTVSLPDGTLHNLTDTLVLDESSPVWSPDGRRMAFVQEGHRLLVMNADGSDKRYVTEVSQRCVPAWSPAGTQIAFFQWDEVLKIIRLEDGTITAFPDDGHILMSPVWSPDGTRLALIIRSGSTEAIRLVEVASGEIVDIPAPLERLSRPAWSGDSQTLALSARVLTPSFGQDIYLMSLADYRLTRLTYPPRYHWNPSWKPQRP